jgi:hypothetical protein
MSQERVSSFTRLIYWKRCEHPETYAIVRSMSRKKYGNAPERAGRLKIVAGFTERMIRPRSRNMDAELFLDLDRWDGCSVSVDPFSRSPALTLSGCLREQQCAY